MTDRNTSMGSFGILIVIAQSKHRFSVIILLSMSVEPVHPITLALAFRASRSISPL